MTEDEQEKLARERLNAALDKFTEEVREVIQCQVHDSISAKEIAEGNDQTVLRVTLGWVQRILIETIADEFGPDITAQKFDDAYFQICSQHIGPDDFRKKAKPYEDI